MQNKISIITVVKNGMPFLKNALNSFELQNYQNKELIVVYSSSNDGTLELLKEKKKNGVISKLIIDNDSNNKFGSLNVALENINSDYFGILHADDIFFSQHSISEIMKNFNESNADIIYGNVIFCNKKNILNFKRYWKSSKFKKNSLLWGWMPPHTSMFFKKKYKDIKFNTNLNISSDYDFIIRVFEKNPKCIHINKIITLMRLGGDSTNLSGLYKKFFEDLSIIRNRFKTFVFLRLLLKIFRKFDQFFFFKNKAIVNYDYIEKINKN